MKTTKIKILPLLRGDITLSFHKNGIWSKETFSVWQLSFSTWAFPSISLRRVIQTEHPTWWRYTWKREIPVKYFDFDHISVKCHFPESVPEAEECWIWKPIPASGSVPPHGAVTGTGSWSAPGQHNQAALQCPSTALCFRVPTGFWKMLWMPD